MGHRLRVIGYGLWVMGYRLRVLGYSLLVRVMIDALLAPGYGLHIMDYGLGVTDIQGVDHGL